MIRLDGQYSIVADTHSWCIQKEIVKTRKDKETGEKVKYTASDKRYFPKISQCLEFYINDSSRKCASIEQLQVHLTELHKIIDRVAKIYVSAGKLIQTP